MLFPLSSLGEKGGDRKDRGGEKERGREGGKGGQVREKKEKKRKRGREEKGEEEGRGEKGEEEGGGREGLSVVARVRRIAARPPGCWRPAHPLLPTARIVAVAHLHVSTQPSACTWRASECVCLA